MLRYITVLLTLMFIFGCGEQPENNTAGEINNDTAAGEYGNNVVLTVGDRTVTGATMGPVLERLNGDSLMVNMKLEALTNRLLLMQDIHERGFDSTRDMELFACEREREQLQNLWLVMILDEKVKLPQDTVDEYYSQMGTILVYRAITVSDRAFCERLRQLVIDGENMGDLAEEYSTIPREKSNRGVLGPIDLMETLPEDYPILQGLETGELSAVDSSRSGWRFVRIDSIYQDTVPPIEEIRDMIGNRIIGKLKMAYKEELFDSLRTVNNYEMADGISELISEHFPENNQKYEPFTPEQENMVAYSFTGGERTLYALVENIKSLPPMPGNVPNDPEWIETYSQLLGLYDIMAMEAKKLGMDTLPEVVLHMDQRVGNQLLDIYYAEVIEPRLIPVEDELMEIYEAERDSLIIPEERIFKIISAVGEEQLDLLQQVMESDGDPYSMKEEFTIAEGLLAPGESLLTSPMTAFGIPAPYSEMLFSAEMNEIVICSVAVDRVLVFELMEISPERIATFEESQGQLTAIFKSAKEEEVISGLVDSLSSVYHIETDREFIDRFIYADSSSIYQP